MLVYHVLVSSNGGTECITAPCKADRLSFDAPATLGWGIICLSLTRLIRELTVVVRVNTAALRLSVSLLEYRNMNNLQLLACWPATCSVEITHHAHECQC